MGAGAKPADADASLLTKEVGARLRKLRRQAGLTQIDATRAVIALFAEMQRKGELD